MSNSMAEYKNFTEKQYIPEKVSDCKFYFAYLAARKEKLKLSDSVLEKWYDNMDASYQLLAASFLHEDENLAKSAFENAVNKEDIDVIEILHSAFPRNIFPSYSYESYVHNAILSEKLNTAFHLALYNNWKTKAEEIADKVFRKGNNNILAFDCYQHLGDVDKSFQAAERILKIDKIKRPAEWEITNEDKEKILLMLKNDLGSTICKNIEFDPWEWFMMMYYDRNEAKKELETDKFESDFEESFTKHMVGPP